MYSQSAPPSDCVSDGESLTLVSDEPFEYVPVRAFSVAEDVVLSVDMGVHPLGDGSRIRISLAADDEMVSWQERLVGAHGLFSRGECDSGARGHRSFPVEDSLHPSAEDLPRCQRD